MKDGGRMTEDGKYLMAEARPRDSEINQTRRRTSIVISSSDHHHDCHHVDTTTRRLPRARTPIVRIILSTTLASMLTPRSGSQARRPGRPPRRPRLLHSDLPLARAREGAVSGAGGAGDGE